MCNTPGCDREIECPGFGLCRNCYGAMLRWSKRTTKEMRHRFERLQLFQARLDSVLPSTVVIKAYKKSDTVMEVLPGKLKPQKKRRKTQ